MQQFRTRLAEELKPDDAQKTQLEEIFAESRQKFARVRDVTNEAERRRQVERIRAETNARIAEMLKPEQKAAWERIQAEAGSRTQPTAGRAWTLQAGAPVPVELRLGLTDGAATEILSGLAEGAEVIVGVADGRAAAPAPGTGGGPRGRLF